MRRGGRGAHPSRQRGCGRRAATAAPPAGPESAAACSDPGWCPAARGAGAELRRAARDGERKHSASQRARAHVPGRPRLGLPPPWRGLGAADIVLPLVVLSEHHGPHDKRRPPDARPLPRKYSKRTLGCGKGSKAAICASAGWERRAQSRRGSSGETHGSNGGRPSGRADVSVGRTGHPSAVF